MNIDEIRDDIPADVREALVELVNTYGGTHLGEARDRIAALIRKQPRTEVIPRAVVPAPLTEMPESGSVWTFEIGPRNSTTLVPSALGASTAVRYGRAYATQADAQAVLDAVLAREAAVDRTEECYTYTGDPKCYGLPTSDGAPAHWTETHLKRPESV